VKEEVRLRYRPVDLRRAEMQRNLRMRHEVVKCLRRFLEDDLGFVEVSTLSLSVIIGTERTVPLWHCHCMRL